MEYSSFLRQDNMVLIVLTLKKRCNISLVKRSWVNLSIQIPTSFMYFLVFKLIVDFRYQICLTNETSFFFYQKN